MQAWGCPGLLASEVSEFYHTTNAKLQRREHARMRLNPGSLHLAGPQASVAGLPEACESPLLERGPSKRISSDGLRTRQEVQTAGEPPEPGCHVVSQCLLVLARTLFAVAVEQSGRCLKPRGGKDARPRSGVSILRSLLAICSASLLVGCPAL